MRINKTGFFSCFPALVIAIQYLNKQPVRALAGTVLYRRNLSFQAWALF